MAWERQALTDLATADPRLSLRLRIAPTAEEVQHATLGALLAEDKGVRVIDGRADLFSFDERARELDGLETRMTPPPPPLGGDEAEFEGLESELLSRLVVEERARVNEERLLPRSGSELLRGVVATWVVPSEMSELRSRDEWLAARVDELRGSLDGAQLRAVEISELEDALDPLERRADPEGFARSAAAIARLRIALGAAQARGPGGGGWGSLSEGLRVHLGIREPAETLQSEFGRTEARLRDEASARLARLPEAAARAVERAAAESLLVEGACDGPRGRSEIRNARPPPERAPLCGALHLLSDARTEAEALAALLALHDEVAIAQWAMAIHVEGRAPEQSLEGHPLLSEVPPEHEGRLVRFAATRPLACLALARMARMVEAEGEEGRQPRAKRWLAFGDAPLDIVEREWGPR